MDKKILTIDLSKVEFQKSKTENSGKSAWIEIIHVLEDIDHPLVSEINENHLIEFEANFKKGIPSKELPIDYFHLDSKQAAGWVKDIRLSDNGKKLEGLIEFTPNATKMIQDKEIRFFSPTFTKKFPHNDEFIDNVILGGALTNQPFLKLDPIELSKNKLQKGEEFMSIEKITMEKIELSKENDGLKIKLSKQGDELKTIQLSLEQTKTEKIELSTKIKEMEGNIETEKFESEFSKLLKEGKVSPGQKDFLQVKFSSKELSEFGKNAPQIIEFDIKKGSSISSGSLLTDDEKKVAKQYNYDEKTLIEARKGE